jgi:hypothetical protein
VSRSAPDARIPVGVVVERRKAVSPWIDFTWQPVAVLPGQPDTAPWTPLEDDGERTSFYAGGVEVALFRGDTAQYRDNLASGAPMLWVVLRPRDEGAASAAPYDLLVVTADPSEGEAYTEAGADLVDSVPMPGAVAQEVAAFVTAHHVERPFYKRARTPGTGPAGNRKP